MFPSVEIHWQIPNHAVLTRGKGRLIALQRVCHAWETPGGGVLSPPGEESGPASELGRRAVLLSPSPASLLGPQLTGTCS